MQVDFSVCLERHPLPAGGYLAHLTLNAPARLNALTPEMAELLYRFLSDLRDDSEAVAVLLDSAGGRSFCAGADARRMMQSALSNPGGAAVEAEAFLACEYRTAYMIHTFAKPVICWADGLVLGAGLGLMAGASHRIVTENSQLSAPEATIGLLPNAGAGWFLGKMPGKTGLFAALTGARMSAADALYGGLADYCYASTFRQQLLRSLLHLPWCDDHRANHEMLTDALTDWEAEQGMSLANARLKEHRRWIDQHCEAECAVQLRRALQRGAESDPWLQSAAEGADKGAASSLALIVAQFAASTNKSLAEVFKLEMILVANRLRDPEFAEGVRARLIDRDRDPHWCYQCPSEVPQQEIDALFASPWPNHPLADMG
ncbi:MAG: enoyl-CoA hydratase/isomerase family protein [Spongiibacter sp.]|nr:enoyl-CoA hydratase/isomerase family protein [Spongiibacter sp.]